MPRRFHASWKPQLTIQIITDRKLAINSIACDDPDLKIFTDRSGINDKIGASAVLYCNNRKKASLQYLLGSIDHHTVYKGETCGTLLATKLIMNETGADSAIIYTDNRAAITASTLTKPSPGHYLLDAFHNAITLIKRKHPHMTIQLKWVPAHQGIEGNETANQAAKKATTHGSSHISKLPKLLTKALPHSKSASKQAFHKKLKDKTQLAWEKSPRYRTMQHTDSNVPSNKFIKLISPLPRRSASVITQIKTRHFPLVNYLFRISKTPSPICPICQQELDSIEHFILHCPAHHNAREKLRYNTGGRDINISQLLTRDKLLNALIKFIAETGRLNRPLPPSNSNKAQQDESHQTDAHSPHCIPS